MSIINYIKKEKFVTGIKFSADIGRSQNDDACKFICDFNLIPKREDYYLSAHFDRRGPNNYIVGMLIVSNRMKHDIQKMLYSLSTYLHETYDMPTESMGHVEIELFELRRGMDPEYLEYTLGELSECIRVSGF